MSANRSTSLGSAAISTAIPLRGSSKRPRKSTVFPVRGYPSSRGAEANDATSTPFGISTASLPSASICQRLARSDTAMRPTIFSCIGRRMGSNTDSVSDFVVEV